MPDLIRQGTPNFGMLNAGTGTTENSRNVIETLVLNLLDFFEVPWTEPQLETTAEVISEEYYWLSMAEFKLFTKRAIKGDYGSDYSGLNPKRLLLWLNEFARECRQAHADMPREAVKDDTTAKTIWNMCPVAVVWYQMERAALVEGLTTDRKANDADRAQKEQRRSENERTLLPNIIEAIAAGQEPTDPWSLWLMDKYREEIETALRNRQNPQQ